MSHSTHRAAKDGKPACGRAEDCALIVDQNPTCADCKHIERKYPILLLNAEQLAAFVKAKFDADASG